MDNGVIKLPIATAAATKCLLEETADAPRLAGLIEALQAAAQAVLPPLS